MKTSLNCDDKSRKNVCGMPYTFWLLYSGGLVAKLC